MSQKPKQGDSSMLIGRFFCAKASVKAAITCLLPRAAHEGWLGFARKLVQTIIFFVMMSAPASTYLVVGARCSLPHLLQDNCLARTNHPAPSVRMCGHLVCGCADTGDAYARG